MSADVKRLRTALESLFAAEREERLRALQASLLRHTQDMNTRGLLFSSMSVNGFGDICRTALTDLTAKLWDSMLRTHTSATGSERAEFRITFIQHFDATFAEIEAIHRSSTDRLATGLQNQTLIPRDQVKLEYERLLKRYIAELDIHLASEERIEANTKYDSVRKRLLNRPVVIVPGLVIVAVVLLSQFTDALSGLQKHFATWLAGEASQGTPSK